mgnify:CR=1 FL=1
MKIGFVGLGAMGVPMAINLVRARHAVRGFDVRAGAADALVGAGGSAASSAAISSGIDGERGNARLASRYQ